jgi:ABC-type polysaccharide/polyol phosphate transport system ATPase subunit
MAAPAIEVTHVTKAFKIFEEKAQSAKERILMAGRNPHTMFKALDDVTFEVQQGETFALLGHNGSGKSTMLKCVAGTLRPTSGKVISRGRLAALLELGAGFHGDLTGRENIYLNGSILGFSRPQVDGIFDDIVEFSELHDFIDQPVKRYSSGMYARLGFSVAINVEPEILLIDEVLAVGDESFQRKCIDRVRQLQTEGRTILLVSHAADLVRQLADRVAVFDHGRLVDVTDPGTGVRLLRESLARHNMGMLSEEDVEADIAAEAAVAAGEALPVSAPVPVVPGKPLTITQVRCEYPQNNAAYLLPNQPMRLRIDYTATELIEDINFAIDILDPEQHLVFGTDTETEGPLPPVKGAGAVCFDFPRMPLLDGTYTIAATVSTRTGGAVYDRRDHLDSFSVMQPSRRRGRVELDPSTEQIVTDP